MQSNLGPDVTDAEVIEASWRYPDQFRIIFERYHVPIRAYLIRRAGFEIGTEAASETFVAAFQVRGRYDTSYPSAKPWLFGIATNLMRNQLRRAAARRQLALVGDTETPTFADDVAWRADAEHLVLKSGLVPAINELRPDERDVLLLFAFGDLTYQEISEALDIPVGTVRSRLSRLRDKLRRPILDAVEGRES